MEGDDSDRVNRSLAMRRKVNMLCLRRETKERGQTNSIEGLLT